MVPLWGGIGAVSVIQEFVAAIDLLSKREGE